MNQTNEAAHQPDCAWERATSDECAYRATHYYCPHPEHACTCTSEVPASESTLDLEAIEALNHDLKTMTLHGPLPMKTVFKLVESIDALLAEVKRLRAELLKQWEYNHSEHCGCGDVNGPMCQWRYPEVLGKRLREQLKK